VGKEGSLLDHFNERRGAKGEKSETNEKGGGN